MSPRVDDLVGPVLEASEVGFALARVISRLNPDAHVEDRGAYLRVLVPKQCFLTSEAAQHELGRPFRLPIDLEPLMPAFKGLITICEDRIEWRSSCK